MKFMIVTMENYYCGYNITITLQFKPILCFPSISFYVRSRNCEKRQLASSCLLVCPTIRLHETTRLTLDTLSLNLIFEAF